MVSVPVLETQSQNKGGTSNGGRLVSTDGRTLPLTATHLAAEAAGGLARVVLQQTFVNSHNQPLHVRYLLPLPSDGAVSGFSFRIGDDLVVGEIDAKKQARERFEAAIVSGKSAALIEQDRSSLFTQEVGNIPPGETIVCKVLVDQPLEWLAEGSWQWRFPTVVGPRYMGAPGRVVDASKITVDVADGPIPTRATLSLKIADAPTGPIESPSHSIECTDAGARHDVRFIEGSRLDRDVVVRWPVARATAGASIAVARPASPAHGGDAFALMTIVPPDPKVDTKAVPRDLIFLIDTSGSMGGQPLDQAKRVACAMIDTLGDDDRIELIEFGSRPRRFHKAPLAATRDGRRAAMKWVNELRTSGCTEMHAAVIEALSPLRSDAQRQVVLITDGYIGFEREIVETILERLPAQSRLHTIGVGSAPNRTLTGPAARAGRGVELVIGIGEDGERVAERLLARTTRPVVTELVIEGAVATVPARLPDLFAGAPVLIGVRLDPDGGEVKVRGKTASGAWDATVVAGAKALGQGNQAITALYGREWVEDLEMRGSVARNDHGEIDAQIEKIGIEFQIATRLTSWVAIGQKTRVDANAPKTFETMPHELPVGTSIEGFGLRAAVSMAPPPSGVMSKTMAGLASPPGFAAPAGPSFDDYDPSAFEDDEAADVDREFAKPVQPSSARFEEGADKLDVSLQVDEYAPEEDEVDFDEGDVAVSELSAPQGRLQAEAPATEPAPSDESATKAEAFGVGSGGAGRVQQPPGDGAANAPRGGRVQRLRSDDDERRRVPTQVADVDSKPELQKSVAKRKSRWTLLLIAIVLGLVALALWWLLSGSAASPDVPAAAGTLFDSAESVMGKRWT